MKKIITISYTLIVFLLFPSFFSNAQSIGSDNNTITPKREINTLYSKMNTKVNKELLKSQSTIQITASSNTLTPSNIVQNYLISGCLQASNVSFSGSNNALGIFNSNGSGFPLIDGIILSTGNVTNAVGPNSFSNKTTQLNT
ncbi:MAG: hypothetical protein GYA62_05480, partial [Bacteroidales bacterium]|nr:hypothetical protein [Bacteroidales bacterium]